MAAKRGVKVVSKSQPGRPTHKRVTKYVLKANGAWGERTRMVRVEERDG